MNNNQVPVSLSELPEIDSADAFVFASKANPDGSSDSGKLAVSKIQEESEKKKGYFNSYESLIAKWPNPQSGMTAYVGTPFPGTVYEVVSGAWHNTGVIPPEDEVPLNDYTLNGGSTKNAAQLDEEKSDKTAYVIDTLNLSTKRSILRLNGSTTSDVSWDKYSVSDFVPIYALRGSAIKGLLTWKTAQAYPIAFFAENKTIIDQAYTNIDVNTETKTDIVISDELLANYPNAAYARLGTSSDFVLSITSVNDERLLNGLKTEIETPINNNISKIQTNIYGINIGNKFVNGLLFAVSNSILKNDGSTYTHSSYTNYGVTGYIPVSMLYGCTIGLLEAWKAAQANPIAFFTENKTIINTAYNPATVNTETSATVTIDDALLAQYPNAYYVRLGGNSTYDLTITSVNDRGLLRNLEKNVFPSYKFNMFSKVLAGGDSVTVGLVIEGTASQQYIRQVMPEYSYPTQLGKMHPNLDITVKGQAGYTATQWLNMIYPTIDFSQFQLAIFELGLNGYLNFDDLEVEGTNTNDYRKIIQGVRSQNQNIIIVLVRSSHFAGTWLPTLQFMADESNCLVIDLLDTRYVNLNNVIYHAYDHNLNVFDWAHFTRKGYNAKAYVISRLIAEQLSESTQYI